MVFCNQLASSPMSFQSKKIQKDNAYSSCADIRIGKIFISYFLADVVKEVDISSGAI